MRQQRLTEAFSQRDQIGFIKPAIVIFLCSAVFVGGVYLSIAGPYANDESGESVLQKSGATVETFEIDTSGIISGQSLSVGGQLRVNNTLVLSPSSQPAQTSAGQIYFDAGAKEIRYYDGTSFQGIASTGDVEAVLQQQPAVQQPGAGSTSQNITNVTQQTINNYEAATGTVTEAGNNTFTGTNTFTDISVEDFTASGSAALQGSLTVTGTTLLGPASASSLLLSSALEVSSGGTGRDTFNTNEIVIGQGTGALATISNGAPGLCLLSTAGAPSFQACPGGGSAGVSSLAGLTGDLLVANSSTSGSTITIDTATSTNRGLASFNATNLTVTGGSVNTVQDIAVTAAPTFAGITVNGLINGQTISSAASLTGTLSVAGATTATGGIITNSIASASGLSIGSSAQTLSLQGGASSTFSATSGANTTTLQFQTPTANANYRFATATAGTYDVCTTSGNCVGVGGSVSTSGGTSGQIAKFDSGNNIVDSLLSESGVTVTADGNFNIAGGSEYQIDGVQISSSVLSNDSNLAKLNASQTFSGQTIFRNTVDSSVALSLQNAAGNELATLNTTNGSFELGDSSTLDGKLVVRNATNNFTVTVNASNPTGNHTVSLGNESGTICLQNSSGCGFLTGAAANANYVQNQNSAQQVGGNFWIAGTGRADTALQAPLFDAASSGALTLGGANATSISITQDTTLAASKSLTITGGATGTRPAVPTEGMVYYDTTTKRLLTYANGKWQADSRTATKIVAASNSSQASKDAADYVADGTGDQVEINAALAAASGGKVYLLEGTYVANATILIPNNTTLAGSGRGTLIELANLDTTDNLLESSDTGTGTGVAIQDLRLDGRKDLNTAGTQHGINFSNMGGGAGATARQGAKLTNVIILNFRDAGVNMSASHNNTFTGNTVQNNTYGFYVQLNSAHNTFTSNTVQGNTVNGILMQTATDSTFTGNTVQGNQNGINLTTSSSRNTLTGNTIASNTNYGVAIQTLSANNTLASNAIIGNTSYGVFVDNSPDNTFTGNSSQNNSVGFYILASSNNTLTGNTVTSNTNQGIMLQTSNNNLVSGNKIHGSGGATSNNGILFTSADSNTITDNSITDTSATTTNYAINISEAGSDANYLAGNTLGTGSINNVGTGTVFGGQVNSSGNYVLQPAGTIELMKNTNITGALAVTGNATVSGGALTVGTAAVAGSLVINDGSTHTATIQVGNLAGDYVYTIPVTTASDSFCLQTLANCSGGGASTVGALDGGTANADGATISGTTIYLQSASSSFAGFVNTTTQTFAGNKTFVGDLSVQNVSLAANKSLTISGGATGTRPSSPTEGMVYFDTTTKQLITYANGKWQADRSNSTVIVAANNSKSKDSADFVVSSADETAGNADAAITAAIAALPAGGGSVYLMEGTYTIDTGIALPSNVTFSGAGRSATIIRLKNSHNVDINVLDTSLNVNKTNITIQDMRIEGNKTNQTAGIQTGIYAYKVGTGSGTTATTGVTIRSVEVRDFRTNGVRTNTSQNSTIEDVNTRNNTGVGLLLDSSTRYTTINNVEAAGNTSYGIQVESADYVTISDSKMIQNSSDGLHVDGSGGSYNSYTGNTITTNTGRGAYIRYGYATTFTENNVVSNTTDGVYLSNGISTSLAGIVFNGNTISTNGDNGIEADRHLGNATISGNRIFGNTSYGINLHGYLGNDNPEDNAIVGNYVYSNAVGGIHLDEVVNNTIQANTIADNGGVTSNNAIWVEGSNSLNNSISGNVITDASCTTTCYAIYIVQASSTYLSDNTLGGGTIFDTGLSTRYANQVDANGSLINRTTAAIGLNTSTVTSSLTLQGGMTNSQLPTPAQPTVARVGTAGTTTYGYKVTALDGTGETLPSTERTITTANATLTGANYNAITWSPVPGAVQYKIYRTTSGGTPASTGLIGTVTGSATSVFNDTGIAATTAAPATNTTGGLSVVSNIQGSNATFTGGTLTLGTTAQTGSLVLSDGSSNTATLQVANLAGNYTYTIPVTTGNDTFCMLVTANCGGVSTIGALDGGTANSTGATITGSTLFLQSASGTNPGLVNTTTQTFAGNKTFTGILSVQDTTVGAGTSITFVGGITGTRPAVPSEGMVYFDTSTKQLITYSNSKWQASRSSSTKIVAASNSTQAAKDAADYIATGTGDQAQINTALTAAAGGTVYLMEGTYYTSAQISVPNNTTLSGAGSGTILTIPNAQNTTYSMIRNTDTSTGTNVTVRDLQIDGNRANQTGGSMKGINFSNMGAGTGSTARIGTKLSNLIVKNMRQDRGIDLTGSNNIISGSTFQYNEIQAINLSGNNNVITGNTFHGNQNYTINVAGVSNTVSNNLIEASGAYGIQISATYSTVSGNTVTGGGSSGIYVAGVHATVTGNTANANNGPGIQVVADYATVTGNTISGNLSDGLRHQGNFGVVSGNSIDNSTSNGIMMYDDSNQISGNRIHNNGADGIQCFATCNNNSFVGNHITDTAGSSFAIQLTNFGGTPTGNYLSNNHFSGTGASSINDEGTGTIYSNQKDGNGTTINRTQGGAFTIGTSTATASLTLQGGMITGQLAAPTLSATVTNVGTAGSTTYRYQVTALDGTGETVGSTIQQTTTGNATLSGTNYNTITWTAVPGAYQYAIYKCSGAACTPLKKTTVAATATSFNDQSAGSPVGAAPGSNTTGGATFAGGIQGSTASLSSTLTVAGATTLNGTLTGTGTALFKNTANSAAAFQIQDSSSVALFTADTSATKIVIRTLDISYNLTVAGHIISSGSTPAIAADAAACTSPTVNINGTDTAGSITVTTGTGCAAPGALATITFATAFGAAPKVSLTPASANAAGLNGYVDDSTLSTSSFQLGIVGTPVDATVYKWHYLALQ